MTLFDQTPRNAARAEQITKAAEATEQGIRALLFALEETTGMSIDHVDVDTRNFGQLKTEITLTARVRK